MGKLDHLLENSKKWAEKVKRDDEHFFERLSELQNPKYLWIGCSDSRITPAGSIGLLPGELFVHRNIANLVVHTDMNCLSVLQFAVEVLKIEHIIVCGHYVCGGVKAAYENTRFGLIDNWLRHIQDIQRDHQRELDKLDTHEEKLDKLCEINVIEQVLNVGETTILQDAWLREQDIAIHGWIYHLSDGIFQDIKVTVNNLEELVDLRSKMLANQNGN